MTQDPPDFQLTGDDPMMSQIEAATAGDPAPEGEQDGEAGDGPADPLRPGEPESARFEPDASQ